MTQVLDREPVTQTEIDQTHAVLFQSVGELRARQSPPESRKERLLQAVATLFLTVLVLGGMYALIMSIE